MGKVFHIGVGDDGNFAVTKMTSTASEVAVSSLSGKFGTGYDESAVRQDAMTNLPVPKNNNSFDR